MSDFVKRVDFKADTQLVIKLSFGRFLIKVSYVLPDATVTFTTEIQPSLIFHVGDNTDWLYFFFSFYLFILNANLVLTSDC